MFLVEDKRDGATYQVFTWKNPKKDGYAGPVTEGVDLDYNMEEVHSWADGEACPEACLGRANDNPKRYKVFKYRRELQPAGYQPVAGTAVVFGSWSDYLKVRHPEDLPEEEWYASLDQIDEAARRRRQREQSPLLPRDASRDDVAAWLAKRHRFADSAIREVWYLPKGAPPDEIRLLELSDRLAGSAAKVEPIDFGMDVAGVPFHLLVADITSEQFDQIKRDPSRLPPNWSLEGAKTWRRGRE